MLAALILGVEEVSVKAKNPILPEGKEIVWAVIAFAIVFGLLAWKAWPAIKKALKDREDRSVAISSAPSKRASRRRRRSTSTASSWPRRVPRRRRSSRRPVRRRSRCARSASPRSTARSPNIGLAAAEDIRLATERAMGELQGRVAELSIELAEKVVEHNLDRDTQIRLIENYINQVGSN